MFKWTTGVLAAGTKNGALGTLVLVAIPCAVLLPPGNAAVAAVFAAFLGVLALGVLGMRMRGE